MLVATLRRQRWPLTRRILLYLENLAEPCHYTTIARALHWPEHRVAQACWHMARYGRLRWCGEGMYAASKTP